MIIMIVIKYTVYTRLKSSVLDSTLQNLIQINRRLRRFRERTKSSRTRQPHLDSLNLMILEGVPQTLAQRMHSTIPVKHGVPGVSRRQPTPGAAEWAGHTGHSGRSRLARPTSRRPYLGKLKGTFLLTGLRSGAWQELSSRAVSENL